MRTYIAAGLSTLVAAALLGGCVPKEQLDECRAANRVAHVELEKTQEALRQARAERDDLSRRLQRYEGEVRAGMADVETLEEANARLREELEAARRQIASMDAPVPPPIGPLNVRALPERVDEALQEFAEANPDLVRYFAAYGMVKLESDLTFELGSDFVKDDAKAALRRFVGILDDPAAREFNCFIAGHTDNVPIKRPETKRRHPDNWYLSVHRAVAVQQVMQEAGLAPERICAMGFGEYHPVEPNKPGDRGNPANRRVEIWIVPPDRFLTRPMSEGEPGVTGVD